uniref:Uncharacterized protein n=1 Tax=Trichogramma kaykai TaxID=54128 RepID=A0ABD2WPB6_9HYME
MCRRHILIQIRRTRTILAENGLNSLIRLKYIIDRKISAWIDSHNKICSRPRRTWSIIKTVSKFSLVCEYIGYTRYFIIIQV